MIIRLTDVTEEGEDFDYKNGDEPDLDRSVKEALGYLPAYNIKCRIQELGNVYSAQGKIETVAKDTCSLCGEDLDIAINHKFNEYLIKQEDRQAEGHAPHMGLDTESQAEATFFESYDFDLGDFFREQIVVAIPNYPRCADTKACEARQDEIKKKLAEKGSDGHPAFAVLKDLKKQ